MKEADIYGGSFFDALRYITGIDVLISHRLQRGDLSQKLCAELRC